MGEPNQLTGKSFAFTGALGRLGRYDAEDLVKNNGGTVTTGVPEFLVVGLDPGSALNEALRAGNVKLLTEQDFMAMTEQPAAAAAPAPAPVPVAVPAAIPVAAPAPVAAAPAPKPENAPPVPAPKPVPAAPVPAQQNDAGQDGNLVSGKTFLFTGTLSQFKRSAAEDMVKEKGGTILSKVTAKLNYLVVGADAGSKLAEAKNLGTVKIISENDFLALLG